MDLFGCKLQAGYVYQAYVYAEGTNGKAGILSDGIAIAMPPVNARVVKINFFLEHPQLLHLDEINGESFSIKFTANSSTGYAWSLLISEELLTRENKVTGIWAFRGEDAVGGPGCQHAGVPIGSAQYELRLDGFGLTPGLRYIPYIYICSQDALDSVAEGQPLEGTVAAGPVVQVPYVASAGFR